MLSADSIISPTNHVVEFHGGGLLLESVYEDQELRRLVPHVDEMLGDIKATWARRDEADDFAEEFPEWDDPDELESDNYAQVVRDQLIDAGCIFAEQDWENEVVTFSGLAKALKRSLEFCVALAGNAETVLRIVNRPISSPVVLSRQSSSNIDRVPTVRIASKRIADHQLRFVCVIWAFFGS